MGPADLHRWEKKKTRTLSCFCTGVGDDPPGNTTRKVAGRSNYWIQLMESGRSRFNGRQAPPVPSSRSSRRGQASMSRGRVGGGARQPPSVRRSAFGVRRFPVWSARGRRMRARRARWEMGRGTRGYRERGAIDNSVTSTACSPLRPCSTRYSTACPRLSIRKPPAATIAEWCTKTSWPSAARRKP